MLSSSSLKIIAIICMLCDHISDSLLQPPTMLNMIGRIAFPIFAFQITEGYVHTKSLKKYFIRLIIFACISQIPFMLFLSTFTNPYSLNVFFTLIFGLLGIYLYDKIPNKFLKIFPAIGLAIIAELLNTDYGAFGIAIIMIFYIFKNNKVLMGSLYFCACTIYFLPKLLFTPYTYIYLIFLACTVSPLLFILLYNGKQGLKLKYLLYVFYPLHLLILYLIHIAIK